MALAEPVGSVSDGGKDGILGLASGLSIGDGDDEDGFLEATAWVLRRVGEDALDDLPVELSAHRGQSREADRLHELLNLLVGLDVVDQMLWRSVVHETDRNAVIVKQRGCECDTLENETQILDSLTVFLKLHGTAVVHVEDDIKQTELDDIISDLLRQAPALA